MQMQKHVKRKIIWEGVGTLDPKRFVLIYHHKMSILGSYEG